MESGMLADMEVDKVADMFKTKCIMPEMFYLQSIGPKLFDACLLSFASLFSVNIYLRGCVSSAIQTSATPYFVSFATSFFVSFATSYLYHLPHHFCIICHTILKN